jgi:hypothetical protein
MPDWLLTGAAALSEERRRRQRTNCMNRKYGV